MIIAAVVWYLMLSIVLGQLVRLPLPGQSGGLLVSDMAVVAVLFVALVRSLRAKESSSKKLQATRPAGRGSPRWAANYKLLITPFIIWSLFTLVIQYGEYSTDQLMIGFAYWLRTSCYLLLLPALVYLARDYGNWRTLHRSFIAATVALTALGWLQRILWPNLADLPVWLMRWAGGGWDPHVGRAVSTWLDPNFFGAFLGLALLYCLGCFFSYHTSSAKLFFLLLLVAVSGLGMATQSRSSLIAMAVTIVVLSPVILLRLVRRPAPNLGPIMVGVLGLAALASCFAAVAVGDRLFGLLTSDDTVQVRIDSLQALGQVASEHPLVGVGYNLFQFATHQAGLPADFSLHSRAGADNSWLTLLITTGAMGALLFALPWVMVVGKMLRRWLDTGDGVALAAAVSVVMLTVHSQFINSWLYGHLIIVVVVVVVLAEVRSYDQALV